MLDVKHDQQYEYYAQLTESQGLPGTINLNKLLKMLLPVTVISSAVATNSGEKLYL